jgi:hypothetical protein
MRRLADAVFRLRISSLKGVPNMQTKPLIVASLVVPLLLISCSRENLESPVATGTSEQRQAAAPADPAKVMEDSPPAAGAMSAPDKPEMEPAPAAPPMADPATPPNDAAKGSY